MGARGSHEFPVLLLLEQVVNRTRPAGPVLPLVLWHGWPDSFWRYAKVIGLVRPPRAWLERTANVVRVTEPARGGHFAPFEEPELYAEELRAFFRPYRAAAG